MPTSYKNYPIYRYNEPSILNDFTGGINSDPSNERLMKNEMRDCVNMTYMSGALIKRPGATEVARFDCEDQLHFIQGVFLYTYRITYVIVAADGKLYQGVWNENTTIQLTRLPVIVPINYNNLAFDPQDTFSGLSTTPISTSDEKTNGYIYQDYRNTLTNESFASENRGSWDDQPYQFITINGLNVGKDWGIINKGDVFTVGNNLVQDTYLCIKPFEKKLIYPGHPYYYEEISAEEAALSPNAQVTWTESTENVLQGYIYLYQSGYYKCTHSHTNTHLAAGNVNKENFVNLTTSSIYVNERFMIFQNYRRVEAATLNNKLIIATGTRVVEVGLVGDELSATTVKPYMLNYNELINIGYNYMSPYPELAIKDVQTESASTGIMGIKVQKMTGGEYILSPVMTFADGKQVNDYCYRWEKYINDQWVVISPFCSQIDGTSIFSISARDADQVQYRCTFADDFVNASETMAGESFDTSKTYSRGNQIHVNGKIYECIVASIPPSDQFSLIVNGELAWKEVYDMEAIKLWSQATEEITDYYDFIVNKATAQFGQAYSVLFNNNLEVNETYKIIQSCVKVIADGNKLLFYDDAYNSGLWYKTIINNPGYITDRGCLSFKTSKNESVIKVIPFQGNIIVFANSIESGGSIHMVKGNGDDYDDQSGYYSPYQRTTINASISCDNADTVQICDNILVFKFFNRIYYINASDLSNDVVKVTPCNTRLMFKSNDVDIPWDDNDCISEVTSTYYAIIWNEKYEYDENVGDLILKRQGLRLKMYYNMAYQLEDGSYVMPWLRDESKCFNVSHVVYINGNPLLLYHNILLDFSQNQFEDMGEVVPVKIHLRASDTEYQKIYKFLSNVLVYYHRDQYQSLDFTLTAKNEAGHNIINTSVKKKSLGDLKAIKESSVLSRGMRVGSTIVDSRVITPTYMFPYLLIDVLITETNKGIFGLSSITFNYTATDSPETTSYDLYSNIIRPQDQ